MTNKNIDTKIEEPSIFEELINQYAINKTLRFELRPTEITKKLLEKNNILKKDETIAEAYPVIKYFFDRTHRDLIRDALAPQKAIQLPFKKLHDAYSKYMASPQEERKKDKVFENAKKEMYIAVRKLLDDEMDEKIKKWQEQNIQTISENDADTDTEEEETDKKTNGINFLLSAKALNYLRTRYPQEDDASLKKEGVPSVYVLNKATGTPEYVFDIFAKFTGYLASFQKTRENIYATDGENTAVSSRIVANAIRFFQNEKALDEIMHRAQKNNPAPTEEEEKSMRGEVAVAACATQEGINTYNKNIGKINTCIKEWPLSREEKPRLLKRLEKQILSEALVHSELIENEKDILKVFATFVEKTEHRLGETAHMLMGDLFSGKLSKEHDLIYINAKAVNSIAYALFQDPISFLLALPQTTKKPNAEDPKISPFISITDVLRAVSTLEGKNTIENDTRAHLFKERFYENHAGGVVVDDTKSSVEQLLSIWRMQWDELYRGTQKENARSGIETPGFKRALVRAKERIVDKTKPYGSKEDKEIIKEYLDACLEIHRWLSWFVLEAKHVDDIPTEVSNDFYEKFTTLFRWVDETMEDHTEEIERAGRGAPPLVRYYNAFRNILTQKPGDKEKIKINFGKGNLLSGWDLNKEKEKRGVLFRLQDTYYLGIILDVAGDLFNKKHSAHFFENTEGSKWEKMEYKLFPDPKRMIPKISFPKTEKNRAIMGWSQSIQDIKDEYAQFQEEKKSDKDLWRKSFNKEKQTLLIQYYQQCLTRGGYKSLFQMEWKTAEEYKSIGEFNDHIATQSYFLNFISINEEALRKAEHDGLLCLFQIHNKDWNLKNARGEIKDGTKNIHTLYFQNLFSEEGKKTLKLNGEAELFYRAASPLETKIHHTKEVQIHKRFSTEKWLLHIPVTLNWPIGAPSKNYNRQINTLLATQKEKTCIIGIDRGEKHLAYYTVIDMKGNILEGGSLNKIGDTDYQHLLHNRMMARLEQRRSWETVADIKNLKKGYVGAVVRKIADLVIQYDAIVVMEDLSFRFKQVRGGIEKSTYQQIEKALIDKLGYLIFKERNPDVPGGALKGYQLTAPFESFEKMGAQMGILFYTHASYTSAVDPVTGFRKSVYIASSASPQEIRKKFEAFIGIYWDEKEQSYCFTYNTGTPILASEMQKNNKKISSPTGGHLWQVYGKVPRIIRERNSAGKWVPKLITADELMSDLLAKYSFNDPKSDILAQIRQREKEGTLQEKKKFIEGEKEKERSFWNRMAYIFNIACQLRNSMTQEYRLNEAGAAEAVGEGVDFIASPVRPFFTTGSKYSQENFAGFEKFLEKYQGEVTDKDTFLKNFNGDTNGAYNIARKGILILRKIQAHEAEKVAAQGKGDTIKKYPNLAISNNEWDEFSQSNYIDE